MNYGSDSIRELIDRYFGETLHEYDAIELLGSLPAVIAQPSRSLISFVFTGSRMAYLLRLDPGPSRSVPLL